MAKIAVVGCGAIPRRKLICLKQNLMVSVDCESQISFTHSTFK
jgi:hypothetical protein